MYFPHIRRMIGPFYDVSTSSKVLDIDIGTASSSVGPLQALYLGDGRTKVRLAPDAAREFFTALDGLARNIRAGKLTEGSYFGADIIDFDNDASLVVDIGIASGRLYFRIGDTEIEPAAQDIEMLNQTCMEWHPLARGGRRGTGRGHQLAEAYKKMYRRQDLRQQGQPQLDNYDRYIKRGEFDPLW
jgi:hypothetical protein